MRWSAAFIAEDADEMLSVETELSHERSMVRS